MSAKMTIRALLVDDEALARARLKQLLKEEPDFEIAGECANGREAITAIRERHPDVVFLDVQMPRVNGIEVCRQISGGPTPLIVFVTAYDQFAVQAFEFHALDYLLKPFDQARFKKSIERVREQLGGGHANRWSERLLAMLSDFAPGSQRLARLAFKCDGRVVFVRVEEIDWIEADGNYLKLHAGSSTHMLRQTLGDLEGRLPPDRFLRVSRSAILNLDRVKEVQPLFYGDYVAILRDGTRVNLSRNYRERLEALLLKPRNGRPG